MTGEKFIHAARRIMDTTLMGDYDSFSKTLYEFAEHVLSEVGYADRIDEVRDYKPETPPQLPPYSGFAIVGETGPESVHIAGKGVKVYVNASELSSAFTDASKWKLSMEHVRNWSAVMHGTWVK